MAPKKDAGKGGPAQRDECVAYALECLWTNLDQHLKDKFIFPQIVSHAVARTVAGMVHMVSVGIVQRLENWDAPVEGRVPEEWSIPKEPVLPPIDAWARGVVPVKRPQPPLPVINAPVPSSEVATSIQSGKSPKSPISPTPRAVPGRRTTFTLVPSSPTTELLPKASEIYDRKGSPVRRFSDGTVLPPELIHKFKPPDDAASTEGSVASGASSLRKERKSIRKSVLHLDPSSDSSPSRRRASKFAEAGKPPATKDDTANKSSIRRLSMK